MSTRRAATPEPAPAAPVDALPVPELPAGFIEIVHPDLPGAPSVIPEDSLGVHAARGWVRADAPADPPADEADPIDEVTTASDEQEEEA